MTKSEAIKQFNEQYQKLTDSQQESFSRIALRLLDETYLIREKETDKKDYFSCTDREHADYGDVHWRDCRTEQGRKYQEEYNYDTGKCDGC